MLEDLPERSPDSKGTDGATLLNDLNPNDWKAARQVAQTSTENTPADRQKPGDTQNNSAGKTTDVKAGQTKNVSCIPDGVGMAAPLKDYSGFDMSPEDITKNGLDEKVATFKAKITEAMQRHGVSYKIDLRIVDKQMYGPYGTPSDSDIWTDVVRDKDMRNESFVISVTAKFLKEQPEILFESGTLHEVAHIMNDDLTGYHRQGGNSEFAEERRVADLVSMPRYEEYLRAYTKYKPNVKFDEVMDKVKNLELVPPPLESDDADKKAAEYFKTHADGKEHLIVFNGDLHDITLASTAGSVKHDPAKLNDVIKEGKPMIFFHNHPADGGMPAQFPSLEDFGVAGLYSSIVYRENPSIPVEFRVMQIGKDNDGKEQISNAEYGFKKPVIDEIKKTAEAHRDAKARNEDVAPIEMKQKLQNYHLSQESYNEYLKHAYLLEVANGKDRAACGVRPKYFLWPSDKFFVKDRPQSLDNR